jgi:hypothetical protein
MTVKHLAIDMITRSVNDLFRSAKAMPEDKLTWRSGESCRTALEYLQECAQSLSWPKNLLQPGGPNFDPEMFQKAMEERAQWTTVEACESAARKNLAETTEFIRDYPEDDLDRKISLPFMPDLTLSAAELLVSPYWNMTYHLGQINFIQLMYGDKEMH